MKRPKKAGAARRRNTSVPPPRSGVAPHEASRPSPVLNCHNIFTREDLRLSLRALKGFSENGGVSRKQMNLIARYESLLSEAPMADAEDGETMYPVVPVKLEDEL